MLDLNEKLEAACGYASRGWRVFPLHTVTNGRCSCGIRNCGNPGKHPQFNLQDLEHGVNDATTDQNLIRTWWKRWPDANVGIAMGEETGLFALDVDPRHDGEENLSVWLKEHGRLPETIQSLTGGGGFHYLFEHPGWYVQGRSGEHALAPGVEIKGDGGYIVAPPSTHVQGPYVWEASSHPDDVSPGPAPAWLLALLKPQQRAPASVVSSLIADGTRNDTLTSLAGSMRRRGFEEPEILAALKITNERRCVPPMPDTEVATIASSVCRYAPEDATSWRVSNKDGQFSGLETLRRIATAPPRYEAVVFGKRVALSLDDVMDFRRFKKAVFAQLHRVVSLPPPEEKGDKRSVQSRWEDDFLGPASRDSEKAGLFEEAPSDASAPGAAWQSVLLFFSRVVKGDGKDDVFNDRLVELEGFYVFRGRVLRKWLAVNKYDILKADELWSVIRDHGGRSASLRTSKGVIEAWKVPMESKADE